MRNILFLLLGIALFSCAQYTEFKRELNQAEALMQENPDSAYRMLCAMNGRADSVSTSLRMRHLLLRSNAQNKADVLFTSDSIGSLLVEYYDSHGTPNERMLAHYMQGCAYRDMGDWPSAVVCFNKAVAAADTAAADCDFKQLSIIYGQIGYIYGRQYLIEEALQAYDNAEKCAQDTSCILAIWEHKSNALIQKGEVDEGLRIKEAIIAHNMNQGLYQSAAMTKGACIKWIARKGDFKKAGAYIDDYETLSGFFLPNGDIQNGREDYYHIKATYYVEKGELDSAEYYLRKLQRTSEKLNDRYLASLGLTRLYRAQQNADSVAKYAWQTFQYSDSLYDENVAQNMQQAHAMYDYSRHKEVAHRKDMEAKEAQIRLRNVIIVATILFFSAVLLFLAYRRRLRLKAARLRRKLRTRLTQNSAAVDKLNGEIREKTQLISLLHKQLNENAVDLQESEQMRRTISILEQKIQEHRRELDAFTKYQNASCLLEEPAVAHFIHVIREGKRRPNREEWQRIFMLVEAHHPGMKELNGHRDVSHQEYRICVLLKLGLRVSDILFVEETSNSNLSNIRSRLHKKVFGTKGGAKDFDRHLAEI